MSFSFSGAMKAELDFLILFSFITTSFSMLIWVHVEPFYVQMNHVIAPWEDLNRSANHISTSEIPETSSPLLNQTTDGIYEFLRPPPHPTIHKLKSVKLWHRSELVTLG
jgi:hypothetical protein